MRDIYIFLYEKNVNIMFYLQFEGAGFFSCESVQARSPAVLPNCQIIHVSPASADHSPLRGDSSLKAHSIVCNVSDVVSLFLTLCLNLAG